jgi:hypothetical protein
MKAIILTTIIAGALWMTSCSDDRDNNPTVQQPSTFVLNAPALAGNLYDLANTESINLTYKQPEYGFTAAVNYYAQVSLTGQWIDATEDTDATYTELDGSYTECQAALSATAINRAILKQGGYSSEADMPADGTPLYVRMRATLASGYECYSNVLTLNVLPYYQSLTATPPVLWYLVGGSIGDGSWGSAIGKAAVPMCPVENYDFDENGLGELTYTGYFFPDAGFKIIKVPGTWDENEWGGDGNSIDSPHLKATDGEAGSDFKVPSEGYYTITLNTKSNTMVITATADTPRTYAEIGVSGSFNSWAYEAMTAVNASEGGNNHVWTYDIDSDGSVELKFLVDGWSPNWGAEDFPYGYGTLNGANIPVGEGSYTIVFNDITGYYYFYSK